MTHDVPVDLEVPNPPPRKRVGRYVLCDEIGAGGMATVHLGRLLGSLGFARTVAIKHLHSHLAGDPALAAMLIDEACLAVRIRHPNVVAMLDVVSERRELFLVMDYIPGVALSELIARTRKAGHQLEPGLVSAVFSGILAGLAAAHAAEDELGQPLRIVHRDVSPHNVMLGTDGIPRLLDFGIAKATQRVQHTDDGAIKGKIAYMSPEQIEHGSVDHRSDLFSVGVCLWEALAGRRLLDGRDPAATALAIVQGRIEPLHAVRPGLPAAVYAVVARALEREPERRFASAQAMLLALEAAQPPISARNLSAFVEEWAGPGLPARAALVAQLEREVTAAAPLPPHELAPVVAVRPAVVAPSATVPFVVSPGSAATMARPRRAWLPWALSGLLLAALAFLWSRSTPRTTRDKPAAVARPISEASVVSAKPVVAPEPTAATAPSAMPPVTAVATAKRRNLTAPKAKESLTTKLPDCETPFLVDAQGIRRPRPECFR